MTNWRILLLVILSPVLYVVFITVYLVVFALAILEAFFTRSAK
jgi:hypothetical protein